MTRRHDARAAFGFGVIWCRWCGGELGQHRDDWGRHIDASPCENGDGDHDDDG